MKYEKIKEYKEEKFRRITGVKKKTYEKCVKILRAKCKKEWQEIKVNNRG